MWYCTAVCHGGPDPHLMGLNMTNLSLIVCSYLMFSFHRIHNSTKTCRSKNILLKREVRRCFGFDVANFGFGTTEPLISTHHPSKIVLVAWHKLLTSKKTPPSWQQIPSFWVTLPRVRQDVRSVVAVPSKHTERIDLRKFCAHPCGVLFGARFLLSSLLRSAEIVSRVKHAS